MTRIAVVSPYALDRPGGVQEQVIGIVKGLRELGHGAWAIGPGNSEEIHDYVRTVGGVVDVRANRSVAPLALGPRVVGRVRRAIADAEVVHVHEPFMPLTSWGALRSKARVVATFHADPSPLVRTAYRAAAPLLRRVLAKADAVTTVSPVAAAAIRPFCEDAIEIPNGVALPDHQSEASRLPRRVVFLGRDEPRKGLDVLLASWPSVRRRFPDAELVVMGAMRTELPAGVTTLGTVGAQEKEEILATGAVMCAPNLGGESFGITLVEAMAAGCAVVASDLAAFGHVLGQAGRLFPVGDSTALAELLISLLNDPALVAALGAEGRTRAEQFSWERVLAAYERVLLP